MAKTKKLTEGIPVVNANGVVTSVSLAELSRAVGEQLGVSSASYTVHGQRWVRLAKVNSAGGLLIISNLYQNSLSKGVVIAFTGAYDTTHVDAKIISGTPILFDKLRFVKAGKDLYIEVFSCIEVANFNKWNLRIVTSPNSNVELYDSFTEVNLPQDSTMKEYSLADMNLRGGVIALYTKLYNILNPKMKGGCHEHGQDSDKCDSEKSACRWPGGQRKSDGLRHLYDTGNLHCHSGEVVELPAGGVSVRNAYRAGRMVHRSDVHTPRHCQDIFPLDRVRKDMAEVEPDKRGNLAMTGKEVVVA